MPSSPRAIVAALLVSTLAAVACSRIEAPAPGPKPDNAATCKTWMTRPALDESLELGRANLLANQRPEGNFNYEYDWRTRTLSPGDNAVRQAGATWGVALLHLEEPRPETREALRRAFAFWEKNSRTTRDGRRYVVYPGEKGGALGTVALVALAHIELLRAERETLPPEERARLETHLAGYLAFLLSARRPAGLFAGHYSHATGTPAGKPSPYSDGEALLALAEAARHLGRDDLKAVVLAEAEAGWQAHHVAARKADPDSDETKGYYQWSAMAWYELVTSGWPGTEVWGDRLLDSADWMVDVHRTLARRRNTAYAYEGILPAWETARQRGDEARARKLGCVVHQGLRRLTGWQVGHSLATRHIGTGGSDDPLARGGVQNAEDETPLRIDVVQHQMHAVGMARRWFLPAP